jgi:alanyl-tRNA synthetase
LLTGADLRSKFLHFFSRQDHLVLPSASLVPKDDPSLLLTVAGMVPFKPYFQGKVEPLHRRITTCQKCLRTSDLGIVGKTARHHTFFEMLGNFSFGDYFKKEAIAWSWEYLTRELGLSPEDLWITVYQDDQESVDIWHEQIGVPREKIVTLGEDSNFWSAGPVGPCGPCSEIMVDLGPERGCGLSTCGVDCDCGRYLEVWNLVFTQFNRDESGQLIPLPRQNIDTGMGLERIASVMQGVASNFDTDLILPLIKETGALTKFRYGTDQDNDIAFKVVADHARAVAFLIADGVNPSNEGRGYVLRRILRRAVRYGRMLGIEGPFLTKITGRVVSMYREPYPELRDHQDYVQKIVSLEEERFGDTLEQGMQVLQDDLAALSKKHDKLLSGQVAFRLYDTYGFPLELTQEILAERGLSVDVQGFNEAMEAQRERARAAWLEAAPVNSSDVGATYRGGRTVFQGYSNLDTKSQILALIKDGNEASEAAEGTLIEVILDVTPFYADSGGQTGDRGILKGPAGEVLVEDTRKIGDGLFIHRGWVNRGLVQKGDLVLAQVDEKRRMDTARNHTATHLLHKALRTVLGEHVQQMGSLVEPQHLRFDFPHFAPLSTEEIYRVEEMVNEAILKDLLVKTYETDRASALAGGAMALFGEKYGALVRVVEVGDFSHELCGGTHVRSTSEIGSFKISSESGIGTGIRRIEAITGRSLVDYWRIQAELLQKISDNLKVGPDGIVNRLEQLQLQLHQQEKELDQLRVKVMRSGMSNILQQVVEIAGVKVLAQSVQAPDMENLRSMGDMLRDQLGSGVIILGSQVGDKVGLVSFVTPDLVKQGLHAGQIIKEISRLVGGGGGGKPEMAQAGGKDLAHLDEALERGIELVRNRLERL